MLNKKILPIEILNWREGDEITESHRKFAASLIADTFNLRKEDRERTKEEHMEVPAIMIAEALAGSIAVNLDMSLEEFKEQFPEISKSNSMIIKVLLDGMKKRRKESNKIIDVGDIEQ